MTDPERLLGRLAGPLIAIRDVVRRLTGPDTHFDPVSGALCISNRPRIAPQAYALRLFPGADESMITSYEEIHRVTIPETYKSVLHRLNGADLFEITLFGVPPLMAKQPPQIDRSTAWPLDVGTAQTNWRWDYATTSTDFFIGYGPWSDEEHLGYFLWPNGRIEALRRSGEQFNCWSDLGEFLTEELARAETLYPRYEQSMVEMLLGARGKTSLWRRLWRRS